MKLKLYSSG